MMGHRSFWFGFIFSMVLLHLIDYSFGGVRSITLNTNKMETINLSLGHSTILHFADKPKKAILGNKNYFNIEFTGNDLTIQPLDIYSTNLFVYGEYHRYGLILNAHTGKDYDDLVNVKWRRKAKKVVKSPRKKAIKSAHKNQIVLEHGNKLHIVIKSIHINRAKSISIIDLEIQNRSLKELALEAMKIEIFRGREKILILTTIFKEDMLNKHRKTRGRIFAKGIVKNNFTLRIKEPRSTK